MIQILRQWFNRYFSHPEAVLLFFILLFGFGLVVFMGEILAPVLASIVIAYLLDAIVGQIQRLHLPRLPIVIFVFLGFLGLLLLSLLVLLPLLWKQLLALFEDLPQMFVKGQHLLEGLAQKFPEFFSEGQMQLVSNELLTQSRNWAKMALSMSWSSITSLISGIVYLVLVPLLVFFFLKDKESLLKWAEGFLPAKRSVLTQVSLEINKQIANYIRGKAAEIVVVTLFTYAVFAYFKLQYAVLLSFLIGVSVLIPYVGGIVGTLPVMLVAYLQWGWGAQFGYFMVAYSVVQGLDATLLVPLLFSEAVNLHPIAIVVATVFFGGIGGFWGVFFAIPLATLVKAVFNAWPSAPDDFEGTEALSKAERQIPS